MSTTDNTQMNHPSAAGTIHAVNITDDNGNPTGGNVRGVGFTIVWQDGPRGQINEDGDLASANGAFVEDVIDAAASRLHFFQQSKYGCEENQMALNHLREARNILEERRQRRRSSGIEGQHAVDADENVWRENKDRDVCVEVEVEPERILKIVDYKDGVVVLRDQFGNIHVAVDPAIHA